MSSDFRSGPIERIISLKPNITDILFDMGVGNKLVGVTRYCRLHGLKIPVVADYVSVDLEAVLRQRPDLVITSSENSQAKQIEALSRAGIKVLLVSFKSVENLFSSMTQIAAVLGEENEMSVQIKNLREILLEQRKKVEKNWTHTPRFVVIVQRRPVMIAAGGTYISSLLESVGLQNVFAHNKVNYPVIDDETLLKAEYDYLLELSVGSDLAENILSKPVISLQIEDFNPHAQSVRKVSELIERLLQMKEKAP